MATDSRPDSLWAEAIDTLRERSSGEVFGPADDGYIIARKSTVSSLQDVLPIAVTRCVDTSDVVAALACARDHRIPFAIRSGGHSFADYSSTPGLLIDLGRMARVDLDVGPELVSVGPGLSVGLLDLALAGRKRVVPFGWCTTVAVGGSALGGGFGPLSRSLGLAADHLVAAQIVLADGEVRQVDEASDPDLFWALRGAGAGNFGVVTDLTFRTRPAVPVTRIAYTWPIDVAEAVIDGWQRFAPGAPDHVTIELVLSAPPHPAIPARCTAFGVVEGDPDAARTHFEEMIDRIGCRPEPDEPVELVWLSAYDAPKYHSYAGAVSTMLLPPQGRAAEEPPSTRFVRSDFFDDLLPAEAITAVVRHLLVEHDRSPAYREIEFVPWGGAIARPPGDTAFSHRGARMLIETTVTGRVEPSAREALRTWVNGSRMALHPWSSGRVYQNYPDPDLPDWAVAYYGDALDWLRQVKRRYDPDGFFAYEQSIRV